MTATAKPTKSAQPITKKKRDRPAKNGASKRAKKRAEPDFYDGFRCFSLKSGSLTFQYPAGAGLGEINRVAYLPNAGALAWVVSPIPSVGFPPQFPTGLGGFSSTSRPLIVSFLTTIIGFPPRSPTWVRRFFIDWSVWFSSSVSYWVRRFFTKTEWLCFHQQLITNHWFSSSTSLRG